MRWSKEDTADFVGTVQSWWEECRGQSREWRLEARECFRMRAGDWEHGQWDEEALSEMSEDHPIISFNKIDVFVSAVCGLEALNRSQVQFIPRKAGRTGMATDIMNSAARYVEDDNDVEFHQSHAFADMVTCGMGWTESFVEWTTNPDGDLLTEHRDPLKCYWDWQATQRNLKDTKRRAVVKPMNSDEITDMWPDVQFEDIASSLFFKDDLDEEPQPHVTTLPQDSYKTNQGTSSTNARDEGYVCHVQWYELTAQVRATIQGKPQTLSKQKWEDIRIGYEMAGAPTPENQPIRSRKFYRAMLCGDKLLVREPIRVNAFTLAPMTGRYDRNQKMWYGLTRSLRDPQDWTNKLLSKILYTMQYNSHGGGYFAEEDAFPDVRKAEDSLPRADVITYLNTGALAAGKLQRKDPMPYPQGLDRLLQVAMQAFPEVTGMSLELLGLADKVQPGVLEASRKQAGMTMLAWAFDALKHYRKEYGRVNMRFIREYLSDGRLIRVADQAGEKYIPLLRDEASGEYDIVVSESPKSTNERERVLALMTQIMPLLKDSGLGVPVQIWDYLPLPTELIEKMKQQGQPDPKETEMQEKAEILQLQKIDAEGKAKGAEAAQKQADAQKKQMEAAQIQQEIMTGGSE